MTVNPDAVRPAETPPCILVVDDDRRVVELLEVAFAAHGYRVVSAADGDEALRRVAVDRPDLVVLDVRLPKRSGLEVCEMLRRDPQEPGIPVILVSATVETEVRLQAFRRGADDYLIKPFSPKELVARVRRLLARSREMSEARRRERALERDLSRARDELGRAHAESRRERRLREMAFGLGHELHRTLDPGTLARRLLDATRAHLGAGFAGLLAPESLGGPLVPWAVRGDGPERLAGFEVAPDSELAVLAAGLGRPLRRHELESLPELRPELPPIVAAGLALVIPLCSPEGLQGLIVTDERTDGRAFPRADLDVAAGLSELAAVALRNSLIAREQSDAMLELLAARAGGDAAAGVEAWGLVERVARAILLPPRRRALLRHAVRLGTWGTTPAAEADLARLAGGALPEYVEDLRRLMRHAHGMERAADAAPEEARAAGLVAAALLYAEARARDASRDEALERALRDTVPPLDRSTHEALAAAAAEISIEAAATASGAR